MPALKDLSSIFTWILFTILTILTSVHFVYRWQYVARWPELADQIQTKDDEVKISHSN